MRRLFYVLYLFGLNILLSIKIMAGFEIDLSTVLKILRNAKDDFTFDIEYRTFGRTIGAKSTGGNFGQKSKVRKRVTYEDVKPKSQTSLANIKKQVQNASQLYLIDIENQPFNIYICNLVKYNGKIIDHEK